MWIGRAMGRIGGTALAAGALLVSSGCEDTLRDEFRAAAANGLQSGLSSIFNGLVDGLIALYEPDEDAAAGGDTTGGTGGEVTTGST